jgi:hypothetical protein
MEKPTGMVKVEGVSGGFLATVQGQDNSLASLQAHVIVPRLKIIQQMTAKDLKDKVGGDGTVCIRPGDEVVAALEEPFLFTPRFFYSEYNKWADRKDTESNRILARSFDPASDIAKRAADTNRRKEVYPDQEKKPEDKKLYYTYVHHFCWFGVIYGEHELSGNEVVLSMERGEYGNGRQFITAISGRKFIPDGADKKIPVPLWGQVWELNSKIRPPKNGNQWYGFEFRAPKDRPAIIKDDEAEHAQAEYLRLSQLHEERRLQVDHAEGDETPEDAAAAGGQKFG